MAVMSDRRLRLDATTRQIYECSEVHLMNDAAIWPVSRPKSVSDLQIIS